ncbi:DHHC zinc finger domain-containing protein [Phanerochaete sordida]|uniref:Palmitoyltransferase n=1 Tax=Phanerochaete sordida TaxID=48140 RepID=A0A9P3G7S3_9APHY|nr:DHHC zinc finger domain-containing protein [Phanerochaete sordida]
MAKDGEGATNPPQGKCCGVVQEAAAKGTERRNKRREKAQPWIVLKLTIGLTLGIIGYASYVYIGRFCVPMIKRSKSILGGRRFGIPFLVIFCILLAMMLWSYAMIVIVSPGKARDHVEPSPEPPPRQNPVPDWWDSSSDLGHGPGQFEYRGATEGAQSNGSTTLESHAPPSEKPGRQRDDNVGDASAIPAVQQARVRNEINANGHGETSGLPAGLTRRPPMNPALLPEWRYCYKDGFVKPPRAHHCRACGTCILKYDHHCPWIGQCVGARNHKFFVVFLEWAAVFCMWTFATLVAGAVQEGRDGDLDAQYIVIIALSGLFILFTLTLLATHVRLIILNTSTVESLNKQYMTEREKALLARQFSWHQFGAKRRVRKQWDRDWGNPYTEGNLWWLGSYRENWESVMGHSKWGWFLPIGRSPQDGVNWTPNPRFHSDGRPRPRSQWPAELR